MVKSLIARLLPDARHTSERSAPVLQPILSQDEFSRVLVRERARVDRAGGQFAVLTLASRNERESGEMFAMLAEILQTRLRTTDDVGWLSADALGVLLPTTPASGAWKVADDVCVRFAAAETSPLCTVYTYPVEDDSHDESSKANDAATLQRRADRSLGASNRGGNRQRAVHSLQPLLTQSPPVWKRAMDLFGSIIGIILLAPIFISTMLAIKLASPGPAFFKQWRNGLGGRPFMIYKFRTMDVAAESKKDALRELSEQDGPAFKMANDPRITRIGKLLRATSIDELPQLWNVLRGEMSLVGPRPLPCDETAACESWQRRRLDVMPGLTCIWQVRGRSVVSFDEWVRMDVEYIRTQSLWTDIKLIAQTIPAMVLRKGV